MGLQIPQGSIFERPLYLGVTSLTLTMTISKNGAAFATATGGVTELTGGWYLYTTTAADTNTVGALALLPTGSGLPTFAGLPVDQVYAPTAVTTPIVVE